MESKTLDAYSRLNDILDTLRKECPWDKKQTLKSLRYLTIEEVHELSEAIVTGNTEDLKKELGDLAMHIVFYMKIAEEQGLFTAADVYNAICDKLVSRHPFIYDKENYHDESWEQLKMREGRKDVLEGVPDSLPSMIKAIRMQEKVAGMRNGEWKLEIWEVKEGMTEEEFGNLIFSLIDWARRHGINADDALCGTNARFREKYKE